MMLYNYFEHLFSLPGKTFSEKMINQMMNWHNIHSTVKAIQYTNLEIVFDTHGEKLRICVAHTSSWYTGCLLFI